MPATRDITRFHMLGTAPGVELAPLRKRALTAAVTLPEGEIAWSGPIMGVRTPTADARVFENVTNRPLPLSLTIDHDGVTEIIGRIDTIEERADTPTLSATQRTVMEVAGEMAEPAVLWATGTMASPDLGPEQSELAREVARMIALGYLGGVSVEVGDIDMEYLIEFVREGMDDDPDGYMRIPYGRDVMLFRAGSVGALSVVHFPAFGQARITLEGVEMSDADTDDEATGDGEGDGDASTHPVAVAASVNPDRWSFMTASSGQRFPSIAAFEEPEPHEPTPVHVTDDRRIFGHFYLHDSCHRGFPGECVTAERSPSDYAEFMLGGQRTAEGHTVAVGRLTLGGNHAPTSRSDGSVVGADEARRHYEDNSAGVARVAAVDGMFGGWMCGIIPDHVTDAQIDELLSCPPSGDWREIPGQPFGLDMIALHAVNNPGFPVPRARVASCGDCEGGTRLTALVAGASAVDLWELAHEARRNLTGTDLAEIVARFDRTDAAVAELVATLRALGLDEQAASALRARL